MRRVFGSGFDDLVAREDASGVVKWYGTDHLGSVRAIFDNSGGVSNAVDYDAFGGIVSGVNVDRYSWTGREADSLTGLRHHRARDYDPAIGRWTSEDPIGFAAGDVNLFRYVGNEATGATDPSGYAEKPPYPKNLGGVSEAKNNIEANVFLDRAGLVDPPSKKKILENIDVEPVAVLPEGVVPKGEGTTDSQVTRGFYSGRSWV